MDEEANRVDFPKAYRDKAKAFVDSLFTQSFQRKFAFYREKALWPASCLIAVAGLGYYFAVHGIEMIPRYHNYAIRKSYEDREAPPSIYSRESKIRGCFVGRISSSSSSQIKSFLSHNLNCVNLHSGNLSTLTQKRCVRPLFSVFVRNFHVKRNPIRNSTSLKPRNKSRNSRNNEYEKEPTFSSYFLKMSSATAFVFSAFALTDAWKAVNKYVKVHLQPYLQSNGNQIILSEMFATTLLILGTNIALFLLWRVPSLRSSMLNWTTVSTNARFPQMLLAAFSHSNLLHIGINMYIFLSFVKAWEHYASVHRHTMPQNLMSADKFMAFYLSAGVVASAGSCLIQNIGGLAQRSLGASGAILGLVGYICCKVPDGKLAIAFLPQYSFSAKNGLIGLALFDTAGLLLSVFTKGKYTIFDHAAHLSGLLFGVWYAKSGEAMMYRWADYASKRRKELFGKR